MSWINGLEEAALKILFWNGLEVEEVEDGGSEEGGEDEEKKTEPVLEAEYASDSAGEAGGDELDVVDSVIIKQDVRGIQSLLLIVWGEGRHGHRLCPSRWRGQSKTLNIHTVTLRLAIIIQRRDGTEKMVQVGVLGATGTVGQRFIALLENHPNFVVYALGASARSAGKTYALATNWKQTTPIPASVRDLLVQPCVPEHFKDCAVIFSGLDADVAGDIGAWITFLLTLFAH